MKKILNRIIIPLCIIGTLVTQLINWLLNNEVDLFVLATACFVTPAAIKGWDSNYKISTFIYYLLLIVGLILMVSGIYINFLK